MSSYSYKYDADNNITEKNDDGNAFPFSYDELSRMRSSVNVTKKQQHDYNYDIRSNITKEQSDYGILPNFSEGQYEWNASGLVKDFKNAKGENYNYVYNYNGLRTKKINNNNIISYYYSDEKLIGEEQGNSKSQYIRGNQLLAKVVDGNYYYYIYNGHGDVVQIADESGNIVNRYTYDEWGKIADKEEKIKNAITYAGEYLDEESNTYYLKGRYYDPAVRRFISEDTKEGTVTNPLSFNLYIYCYDNPMMYFDPSGNTPVSRTSEGGSGGYHWTLKNRIKYAAKRWVERYNYVKGTYVKIMSAGGGISEEDAGLAFDLMSSYLSGEIIGGGIKAIKQNGLMKL